MTRQEPFDPADAAQRAGVRVRAGEPSDIAAIGATMNEYVTIRGTLQVPYTSTEFRREQFGSTFTSRHTCFLVAEPLEGGAVIGNLGLHRSERPRRIHTATLGMGISGAWQGRGVGTALMAAALDLTDNWWQVTRIHLEVYTDNEAAIALYRKFGFQVEGTLRKDAFRDGELVDTYVMARLLA